MEIKKTFRNFLLEFSHCPFTADANISGGIDFCCIDKAPCMFGERYYDCYRFKSLLTKVSELHEIYKRNKSIVKKIRV